MDFKVFNSDCLDAMKSMPDSSVDAVVTDPPYGILFMGRNWDHGVPGVAFWQEALRVAKPGAYLLAFGGTRTYHRLACAIEDAGWELRNCLYWVYASGMPKGQNIAKAIDMAGGVDPEKSSIALKSARERASMTREELAGMIGCTPSSIRDWEEGRSRTKGGTVEFITPSEEYRRKLDGILGFTKDERVVLGLSEDRRGDGSVYSIGHTGKVYSDAMTELAKKWDGWNTQLKPAVEPIIMAMKPVEGTIVHNVLKYGTGAINIGGCRVPYVDDSDKESAKPLGKPTAKPGAFAGGLQNDNERVAFEPTEASGRYPSNLIHDGSDEVVSMFPESSGCGKARVVHRHAKSGDTGWGVDGKDYDMPVMDGGSGSAARFFYCAKPSKKEKAFGCGDGGNSHVTVKPVELMKYLVRLVCRKGGTVLDPFCGSGTTGIACSEEGMDFIGCEKMPEYAELAAKRISAWSGTECVVMRDGAGAAVEGSAGSPVPDISGMPDALDGIEELLP